MRKGNILRESLLNGQPRQTHRSCRSNARGDIQGIMSSEEAAAFKIKTFAARRFKYTPALYGIVSVLAEGYDLSTAAPGLLFTCAVIRGNYRYVLASLANECISLGIRVGI